jgi:hypothetical protein
MLVVSLSGLQPGRHEMPVLGWGVPRSAASRPGPTKRGPKLPTRILRDGINSSARINKLSPGAEILYRRLMSVADDYGRYYANAATVRGACWPTHSAPPCEQTVDNLLTECSQGDKPLISTYEVDGCRYLQINDFNQKIRAKSKFPEPVCKLSADCGQIVDKMPALDVVEDGVEGGVEGACVRGASAPSVRAALPTLRKPSADDLNGQTSQKFDDWFAIWSGTRGNAYRAQACSQYLSVVLLTRESDAMECARSYVAGPGADPGHGYRPDNFLREMAGDSFKTRWPMQPRGPQRQETAIESAIRKAKEAKNGTR